jgi:hypothetical protein
VHRSPHARERRVCVRRRRNAACRAADMHAREERGPTPCHTFGGCLVQGT